MVLYIHYKCIHVHFNCINVCDFSSSENYTLCINFFKDLGSSNKTIKLLLRRFIKIRNSLIFSYFGLF